MTVKNKAVNHKKAPSLSPTQGVRYITISSDEAGQRIDNYLFKLLKNVPKSRIYRLVRKGEVRINKKRIAASYHLNKGDSIRLPPLRIDAKANTIPPSAATIARLQERILFEDENFLILNKPAGMSVHGGSTVRVGIVEALRHAYPLLKHLELAHRLDADTSGVLILAKKKRILREVHSLLREGKVKKYYLALTKGKWKAKELVVDLPLHKNYPSSGKHMVQVDHSGKSAHTEFKILQTYKQASLMGVMLHTGRTHQIRVHACHLGHPIAGDERYGDSEFNKWLQVKGLKRMFLHAHEIHFVLPSSMQEVKVMAPLDSHLQAVLTALEG